MLENWKRQLLGTPIRNHMDSTDLDIAKFEKENEEKNKYFLKKERELFEKQRKRWTECHDGES